MSDILIKNMEIPKSCGECPCSLIFRKRGSEEEDIKCFFQLEYGSTIMARCPLVEVKPHGKLKDFNDILTVFDKVIHDVDDKTNALLCDLLVQIQYAPTVLEASE